MFGLGETRILAEILRYLREIRNYFPPVPRGVEIFQLYGGDMPGAGSNSINAGGTGVFQAQPTPVGSVFPAGTAFAWSSSDADITFAPVSTDPSGATVTATDANGDPATSANVSVAAQLPGTPAPAPLTNALSIAIIQTAPPNPTGVQIAQLS